MEEGIFPQLPITEGAYYMPNNFGESANLPVDEAGNSNPNPPGNSSLTSGSSNKKSPKGEKVPKEGSMKFKESFTKLWNSVKENKNGIVLFLVIAAVFTLALVFSTKIGLSISQMIAIEVIVLAVIFFIKNPLKLGTLSVLLVSLLAVGISLFAVFGLPDTGNFFKLRSNASLDSLAPASAADLDSLQRSIASFGDKESIISEMFDEANRDGVVTNAEMAIIMAQISRELNNVRRDNSDILLQMVEEAKRARNADRDMRTHIANTPPATSRVAVAGNPTLGAASDASTASTAVSVPGGIYYRLPDNYMSGEAYELVFYGRMWDKTKEAPMVVPVDASNAKVIDGRPYVAIVGLQTRDYFMLRTKNFYFGSQWWFVIGHNGFYQSTNGKVNINGQLVTFKKGNSPGGTSGVCINGEIYAFRDMQSGYAPESLSDSTIVSTNPL